MITIDDLAFQYGESGFRLGIPRLQIDSASKVAVVGSSGAGKTTLLHLLAGIYAVPRGRLRVNGVDLTRLGDAARRNFRIANVGLVFQDFELIEYLNVRENILLPYLINRQLRLDAAVRRSADQWAEALGMKTMLKRPIGKLSQGERQRVAICRALLPGPRLLLADEPTGNLDPENTRLIIDILLERATQTGATLVVVTHDHSLLDRFDRVIDFADFQTREA